MTTPPARPKTTSPMRTAADADRKAAAAYRALQDRTMRENQETTRRTMQPAHPMTDRERSRPRVFICPPDCPIHAPTAPIVSPWVRAALVGTLPAPTLAPDVRPEADRR